MTTSTFDATTAGPPPAMGKTAPAAAAAVDDTPDSLLDQLRDAVEDRDESEPDEWYGEIPKVGIRLVCDPNISADDFRRWTKQAMSAGNGVKRRRRASGNAMDMDQFALSCRALIATCQRLDIKRGDEWVPMPGRDGEPLTLESNELMSKFGVMDATSLLRKLYGPRDARIVDAGQELLAAAGYLDSDLDDDDPT
jgi:hypothetical protein